MSPTVTNLIQGAGTLYRGLFGAVEPLDTAMATIPAAGTWTDLGGTKDGVSLEIDQTYNKLAIDQIVDVPEQRLVLREMVINVNLAEATLANLATSLNLPVSAVVSGTGVVSLEPASDTSSSQPTYAALIFDGFAPGGFKRRVIARKVLQTGKITAAYKKDDQTIFACQFECHYVSASIKPWRIIDATS